MGAVGRPLDRHAERLGDLLGEGRAGLVGIELERAADEMAGIDVAQHHVGVGDGGRRAAFVVAHRAGRGAGALGTGLQRAAGIDPDMRAAAGADLGEVDRRHLQRVAGAGQQPRADHDAGADRIFLGARDLAVLDHRGLGGGAAHVEGDDLLELLGAGQRLRADHAAGRPGFDDVHRPLGGGAVGRQAAVRLHQQQAGRNAGAVEPLAQRPEIGGDDRHHIGVDDRGRGALVFLDLGQDLERDAERQVRGLAGDDVAQHRLVHRIGEGVEQADRDRLDLLGEQRIDGAFGVGRLRARARHGRDGRCARRPPCAGSARPAAPAWSR